MKLKQSDIKKYREQRLEQHDICPLCKTEILPEEATLDHDHQTGHVREVLHRSCNQSEGRILSWAKRSRSDNPLEFLKNIIKYWEKDFSENPIHSTFKTDTEKEILKLKRRLRKLKTVKAKQRVKKQIKELQREV